MNVRFFALTFLLQLFCPSAFAQSTDNGKVRVGVILGLTGSMAPVAEEMRRGIDLALSEPDTYPMELIYQDDKGMELKEAVGAAQRLVNEEKVVSFLTWVSSTLPAIAPIANRAKVPVLEFWDVNHGVLNLGPYVFCSGASTELAGEAIASFAVNTRNRRKIGAIVNNDPWSELIAELFIAKVQTLGAQIIQREQVDIGASDLRSILLKMKQKGIDSIYAPLCGSSLYAAIRQAQTVGFEGDIFSADCFLESDIRVIGAAAEGVYATEVLVEDPEFARRYEVKFNKKVSSTVLGYAGLAYDAVRILSTVFNSIADRGEAITSEKVREELSNLHFKGVSGVSRLSGSSEKQEGIVIVKDGQFIAVE